MLISHPTLMVINQIECLSIRRVQGNLGSLLGVWGYPPDIFFPLSCRRSKGNEGMRYPALKLACYWGKDHKGGA